MSPTEGSKYRGFVSREPHAENSGCKPKVRLADRHEPHRGNQHRGIGAALPPQGDGLCPSDGASRVPSGRSVDALQLPTVQTLEERVLPVGGERNTQTVRAAGVNA